MPGLVFGRLFDIGYLRLPVSLASGLLITCTFLTAECTEFWQLLLCQGFGIGASPSGLDFSSFTPYSLWPQICSGIVFNAAVGTIPHWFDKKLGLALAGMATGSSVGGTIFPIILKNLIERQRYADTTLLSSSTSSDLRPTA